MCKSKWKLRGYRYFSDNQKTITFEEPYGEEANFLGSMIFSTGDGAGNPAILNQFEKNASSIEMFLEEN